MSALYDIHVITAWILIVLNMVAGFWALTAQYVSGLRHMVLWWTTGLAQTMTVVVAIVGALIVSKNGAELEAFHALYGFSTIFAVAILYSYRNSPFIADKLHLLYGCGGLFIAGLGVRALFLNGTMPPADAINTTLSLLRQG